jgi:hypothetical protein
MTRKKSGADGVAQVVEHLLSKPWVQYCKKKKKKKKRKKSAYVQQGHNFFPNTFNLQFGESTDEEPTEAYWTSGPLNFTITLSKAPILSKMN